MYDADCRAIEVLEIGLYSQFIYRLWVGALIVSEALEIRETLRECRLVVERESFELTLKRIYRVFFVITGDSQHPGYRPPNLPRSRDKDNQLPLSHPTRGAAW